MNYTDILFDFDGTLADTQQGIVRTVQGTLQRMSLPEADPAAIAKTIGLPLDDCFRLATATPPDRINEATSIYRDIFPSLALDHISLFPDVLSTLALLRQRGVGMAIVSSRHHMSLDPLVQQLGIERFIPLARVFGEGDDHLLRPDQRPMRPKPAPDRALLAMQVLHIEARHTLVVGDTVFDLQMGASAGCHTCGVSYGNQSRPKLETARPDHIIDRFADLASLV